MDKHKVPVEIFGDTYALKGDMEEDRVKRLARMVDRQMRSLTNGARPLPTNRVAVLAAMNICDEYLKLKQDYEDLLAFLKKE